MLDVVVLEVVVLDEVVLEVWLVGGFDEVVTVEEIRLWDEVVVTSVVFGISDEFR